MDLGPTTVSYALLEPRQAVLGELGPALVAIVGDLRRDTSALETAMREVRVHRWSVT